MGGPIAAKHKTYAAFNLEEFERELGDPSLNARPSDVSELERQHCLDEGSLFYLGRSGDNAVYFPTLLSIGSLFTISTDKRAFAQVPIKIPFKGRGYLEGKLTRGKLDDRNPEGYGQLDTYDLRVFMAAIKLWERQGFPVIRDTKSPMLIGKLGVSKYEFVREVVPDVRKPGRDHFKLIENSLMNLSNRPFCISFRDDDGKKKLYGFKLLGEISLLTMGQKGQSEQSSIVILFSSKITEQFRKKRLLHRSLETLSELKSEVAKLAFFYLEPKLISLKTRPGGDDFLYNRMLQDFIHDLGLPPAGWQKYPSSRYRFLKEVTDAIDGKPSSKQGFRIRIQLRKVEDDHKLVAWLDPVEPQLANGTSSDASAST